MNSIQMFELALNTGTRNTTYKFGLLTAITDYIIKNPLETQKNNFHFIPLFYLSKQFIAYYFPLILEGVRQGPIIEGKHTTKIKRMILEFAEKNYRMKLPFILSAENVNLLITFIEKSKTLPTELVKLLFKIRGLIIKQPLKYIRNVKGDQISPFGLLAEGISFQADYETHREAGLEMKWQNIKNNTNWQELLEKETLFLFISHQGFQELSELRFWLWDVLIKRWAQECIIKFDAQESNLLSIFELWKQPPKRESTIINNFKEIYLERGLQDCLYCGKKLEPEEIELDHLIPWSKMPINSFWNLYPCCKECNSKKRDKIPIITKRLESRVQKHIQNCLMAEKQYEIISNDLMELYLKKFNSKIENNDINKQVGEIMEYIRSLSRNLLKVMPGYEIDIAI